MNLDHNDIQVFTSRHLPRILFLVLIGIVFHASTIWGNEVVAISRQHTALFDGPGETFAQVGELSEGVEVQLLERNRTGTWVRVVDAALDEGWVVSGHLEFVPPFQFEVIPQNTMVADGDPSSATTMQESLLNLFPVVPTTINQNMQAVYARGQRLGNQPFAVTKIGDSVVANEWYLLPMSWPEVELGPYAYMQPTLELFGSGMSESIAARQGLTSATAFDPFWADKSQCQSRETPLACEYRVKRPSIAFIMFGFNDMIAMSAEDYHTQMRRIVEESIAVGVIPVLITFSSNPDSPEGPDSLEYNAAVIDVATRYQVPLINLWLATRGLPDYGLERDHIHLKNSGYDHLSYMNGQEAESGVSLLNLLSLRLLHDIRLSFGLDASSV